MPLRLTSDSRFVLWVNGQEAGRGPVRAQPRRWRYESFDIAPFLQPAPNAVAVLVTYYGRATSWWSPAPPEGGINGDAGLVLDARMEDGAGDLVTDASWRVHRSTAWSTLATSGVPCEVLDARALPTRWTRPSFDDSGWPAATVLTARHWGGLGRSRPPVSPYGKLLPRPVARLGGRTVSPVAVLDARTRPKPDWASPHPGARVVQHLASPGVPVRVEGRLPLVASIDVHRTLDVVVDFGAMTAGFVELDIDAPAGTVVELGYREKQKSIAAVETTSDYAAGARYICPGGRSVYSALEMAGLRYLYLTVHASGSTEVTIAGAAVREQVYPQSGRAYFTCDDEEIELANSTRSDGILPLSVAGDFEQYEGLRSPTGPCTGRTACTTSTATPVTAPAWSRRHHRDRAQAARRAVYGDPRPAPASHGTRRERQAGRQEHRRRGDLRL